jgi:hypothetical protein
MGANAPRTPVLPKAIAGTTLSVDGQTVEIRGTTGLLAHRPYAWIPSIKAVVGTIGVFGTNTHVWTADTQTVAERSAWVVPLGYAISVPALALSTSGTWRRSSTLYSLVAGVLITIGSYATWQWLEHNPQFLGGHAHGALEGASTEGHGAGAASTGMTAMRVDMRMAHIATRERARPVTKVSRPLEMLQCCLRNHAIDLFAYLLLKGQTQLTSVNTRSENLRIV